MQCGQSTLQGGRRDESHRPQASPRHRLRWPHRRSEEGHDARATFKPLQGARAPPQVNSDVSTRSHAHTHTHTWSDEEPRVIVECIPLLHVHVHIACPAQADALKQLPRTKRSLMYMSIMM